MATIFPREQKAKMLFEKIKENPQACERLMETFYDALGVGDDYEGNGLSAEPVSYTHLSALYGLRCPVLSVGYDSCRNDFRLPAAQSGTGVERSALYRKLSAGI